jgi:hypothetical protein
MSIGCGNVSGGGWRPQVAGGGQDIFGSQVSAIGSQVRVVGCGCGCGCGPEPEHLNLGPDGRDQGPENGLATAMS